MATTVFSRTLVATALLLTLSFTISWSTHATAANRCIGFELVVDSQLVVPDEILAAICKYYTAENASEWQSTYSMRPLAFREIVPFDLYAKDMSNDKMDHRIYRLVVRRFAREPEGGVVIGFDFFERHASAHNGYFKTIDESTIWRQEDTAWRCVACGQRARITLNHQMSYP